MKSENFTYILEEMKTIEFKMLATFEDMLMHCLVILRARLLPYVVEYFTYVSVL